MKVANSYKNYIFNFDNAYTNIKGKLVVDAQCQCSGCGGSGIYATRVENGKVIPHPAYDGICLACNGKGIIHKTIRVYTDEEFVRMEKANVNSAKKRESEKENKMKTEAVQKKVKWLKDNEFNSNCSTFVYFPADSFDVKETLKADGFKFNPNLLWHIANVPKKYADKCVEVSFDEVAQINAWGNGDYKDTAKDFINNKIKSARPVEVSNSNSNWVGEEKERLYNIPVTLQSIKEVETKIGFTQLVKFIDENKNILTWWTTVNINAKTGDKILLSGTVKKHDEYLGNKTTVLTRCKIKVA